MVARVRIFALAALVDHDHALEEERMAAEGGADVLACEHLGRPSVGDQPAVQQRDQLEALGGGHHVVGAHEDCDSAPLEAVKQVEQRLASAHVHAGEGLVEQKHMRLLGERARQEDTLLLPAREIADRTLREVGDGQLLQGAGDDLAVRRRGRRSQPRRP